MLYKQPTLKKLWNYYNFVQILYSYSCFRYTGRLFRGCAFLLFAVILSGLHGKPRKNKDWVTEKYIEEFKWGTTLFWLCTSPPFYVTFCCFHCLLPLHSEVTYLLNDPVRIHYIAMGGILCDCIMSEQLNIGKSLAIQY